jgi:FkbM family methyltransferase
MYKEGQTMRLEEVREKGIEPNAILDIGAHTGQFHSWAKRVWPDVGVFMIEANPLHGSVLDRLAMMNGDSYLIAALGDEERDVTFYTRSDKPHTEGNSYYKEALYWDLPQLVQESTVRLQKLDNLFEDDAVFEIIKIDTQGSELDILRGGKNLINKASVVILEVSYFEWNLGCPLVDEIIDYMASIGFKEFIEIGEHYWPGGDTPPEMVDMEKGKTIVQKDLAFLNKEKNI